MPPPSTTKLTSPSAANVALPPLHASPARPSSSESLSTPRSARAFNAAQKAGRRLSAFPARIVKGAAMGLLEAGDYLLDILDGESVLPPDPDLLEDSHQRLLELLSLRQSKAAQSPPSPTGATPPEGAGAVLDLPLSAFEA